MSHIIVCPLSALERMIAQHRPSHLVTVISADMAITRPETIAEGRHLQLHFNDISMRVSGLVAPGEEDMRAILTFAADWDRAAPLLVHCWMGVSRSTAAAYAMACALAPEQDESEIARALRLMSPTATPNRRMVWLADKVLGRNGRMLDAIHDIGRGADCHEGVPFTLALEQVQVPEAPNRSR